MSWRSVVVFMGMVSFEGGATRPPRRPLAQWVPSADRDVSHGDAASRTASGAGRCARALRRCATRTFAAHLRYSAGAVAPQASGAHPSKKKPSAREGVCSERSSRASAIPSRMPPVLLPILLALDADPTVADPSRATRWTLSLAADGAARSSTFGASSNDSNATGARGGGTGGVTLYLKKPLLDDDTPYGLQSFLQRTSFLELQGDGLYIQDHYSPAAGGGTYTQEYGQGFLSTRVFVAERVAIVGSLGTAYLHDLRTPARTRDILEPAGSAGIDLRSGDASLTLQWELAGADGSTSATTPLSRAFSGRGSGSPAAWYWPSGTISRSVRTSSPMAQPRTPGFAAYPTKGAARARRHLSGGRRPDLRGLDRRLREHRRRTRRLLLALRRGPRSGFRTRLRG